MMAKYIGFRYPHGMMRKYAGFRWPRGWRSRPDRLAFKRVLRRGCNLWLPFGLLLLLALPVLAANQQVQAGGGAVVLTGNGQGAAVPGGLGHWEILSSGGSILANGANGATVNGFTVLSQDPDQQQYGNDGAASVQASTSAASGTGFTLVFADGDYNRTMVFDCLPAAVSSTLSTLRVSPVTITATGSTSVTITATLTSAAPSGGGAAVSITNTAAGLAAGVSYSSSLIVPSGSVSASETATINYSSGSGSVVFTGTYSGTTASATVTVGGGSGSGGAVVSALSIMPSPGTGGQNSTGTVTLTAAAPAGGYSVALSSSNTAAATVPATVSVPAGATSATFVVTCPSSSSVQTTNISAVGGSGSAVAMTFQCNAGSPVVQSAPTASISLSTNSIAPGGGAVLAWSSSGATTISVTGLSQPPYSGSVNVGPTATTTYTITVSNSAGTAPKPRHSPSPLAVGAGLVLAGLVVWGVLRAVGVGRPPSRPDWAS